MGCVALLVSLILRRKTRAFGKLPELEIGMFRKTFNVFNPYPEKRSIIHEHLELLILLAIYGSFIGISYALMKILEYGFLLAFSTLILCIGFLLIDETLEVHKNANAILRASEKRARFGKGDLEVTKFLKKTLPRLTYYHFAVAVVFFASSFGVPYILSFLVWCFSGVARLIFASTAYFWFFPPFVLLLTAILFAATVFLAQFGANMVKTRIFGFPSPELLNILDKDFFRMKMFVGIQHHHPTLHTPENVEHKKEDEIEVDSKE
jgi:hypothetical protein